MTGILQMAQLVRLPNLLMMAATQYLMRWCIIYPSLKIPGFSLQLSSLYFLCLVLATVFIAAGGYVINDYFDQDIDHTNKPHKKTVGTVISANASMYVYGIFTALGVGLGVILSFAIGYPQFSMIFLLIVFSLFFYSMNFKHYFLVGNLLVAFLTALVPFMVLIFEIPLLNEQYRDLLLQHQIRFTLIIQVVTVFSVFAFLMNLIREIIKDMQDTPGDLNRRTIPMILGDKASKGIVTALSLGMIFLLIYIYTHYLHSITPQQPDYITMVYFGVGLILPLLLLIRQVIGAQHPNGYYKASLIAKGIMVAGMLYAVVFYFIVKQNLW